MYRNKQILLFFCLFFNVAILSAQSWQVYLDSGRNSAAANKIALAARFYRKSLENLEKDSSGTLTVATVKDELGRLYYRADDYESALPFCRDAWKIRKQLLPQQDTDYARSCNNMGVCYLGMEQYDSAEQLLLEAEQLRKSLTGNKNFTYTETSSYLGYMYYNMLEFDKAEYWFKESRRLIRDFAGANDDNYSQACNILGLLNIDRGRFKTAADYYGEALQIAERLKGKESTRYAFYANNLAVANKKMGLYEIAEQYYLQVMEIYSKLYGKDNTRYAQVCNNLGNLYMVLGQFFKSEQLHLQAKKIYLKEKGKENDYAASCENLGHLYRDTEEYQKSLPSYLEALEIIKKNYGDEDPGYARICNGIAVLYTDMGAYSKALPYFQLSKTIREKKLGKDHPDYAESLIDLGEYYVKTGEYEKSAELLNQSLDIILKTEGVDHFDYTYTCFSLANTYRLQKKITEGYDFYKKAFSFSEKMIDRVFGFTNENEKLAYLQVINENTEKFNSFNYTTAMAERQGFAYDINLSQKSRVLQAGENLRKSVSFSGDSVIKRKFNEWKQAREDLAYWLSQPLADRNGFDTLYEEKAGILEKELTRMNIKVNEPYRDRWNLIMNSLKTNEAAIEFTTIDFFDGKKWKDSCYYVAWMIKPGKSEPLFYRLFEGRQLNRLLNFSNQGLGQQRITALYSTEVPGGINQLYKILWKPFEKELKGVRTIYFSPSGLLHKISFAAIPDEEGRLLSDRYELVQLLTTSSVTDTTMYRVQAGEKFTIYGGIEYNADSVSMSTFSSGTTTEVFSRPVLFRNTRDDVPEFGKLEGTMKEVKEISELNNHHCKLTVFSSLDATEENFKSHNGSSAPQVLHLATHGFFFPDPAGKKLYHGKGAEIFRQSDNPLMRSGLALAGANNAWKGRPVPGVQDGILTAYEVSNMYMPATKLAVLSACETGLGDIKGSEGVFGLQRAFKIAGVKNLVMSLWKVPDSETAEFMVLFYKGLFSLKTISESFSEAQTAMKNKYRKQPFKWAAWVLVR